MPGPIRPINVNLGHLASNRSRPPKPPMVLGQLPHPQADKVDLSSSTLAAQRELDGIKTQIGDLVDNRGRSGSGFRVEDVASGIVRARFGDVDIVQGKDIDVHVQVTASAQLGGWYLSFGGPNLDFQPGNSALSLDIGGALGAQELTFTEGTTLADVAAAVNTFTRLTGVAAEASATGVVLRTTGYGSKEFVSVSAGDDAADGLGENTGLYGFDARDMNAVDPVNRRSFANLSEPLTDHGQDIAGFVSFQEAVGQGTMLTHAGPLFSAQLDLGTDTTTVGNALELGNFIAARLIWDGPISPLSDTPPGIDLSG